MKIFNWMKFLILTINIMISVASYADNKDPLPSWNDGVVKQNIIDFVQDVTNKSSKDYVAPANRIAAFDDDGTLWLEQPIYTQVIFMFDRVKQLTKQHPELKQEEPFKSVINNQFNNLTNKDLEKIYALTSSGMSVADYHETVTKWFAESINPRFNHHYNELVYQPMLEVINYLHNNHFDVYIVSGGGQDFMRAFTQNAYQFLLKKLLAQPVKQYINIIMVSLF